MGGGRQITLLVSVFMYGARAVLPGGPIMAGIMAPGFASLLTFTALFVPQAREQNVIYMNAGMTGISLCAGGYYELGVPGRAYLYALAGVMLAYLGALWARRLRYLPPGLTGVKYIKLSYLRAMANNGKTIRRCQELPPEAFGDPRKASYLIIISHRWLNRYTCDVCSDEMKEGIRLKTLLQKLEAFFSPPGQGGNRSGIRGLWHRVHRALSCGCDVLVFFDFMSLPQEGCREDGTTIPRTADEMETFKRCLPNMGILYSTFPVLVCPEVSAHAHSYDHSGWCFSEITIANLGNQLETYSPTFCKDINVEEFEAGFEGSLAGKNFVNEADRKTVRNIVNDFLRKRRLIEGVKRRDEQCMTTVLSELSLSGSRLQSLLDQPIDPKLNTILHVAVAMRFQRGAEILIDYGARCDLLNVKGDSPLQWYLFPRLSRTAWACRARDKAKPGGVLPDAGELASFQMQMHGGASLAAPSEEHVDSTLQKENEMVNEVPPKGPRREISYL